MNEISIKKKSIVLKKNPLQIKFKTNKTDRRNKRNTLKTLSCNLYSFTDTYYHKELEWGGHIFIQI